MIFKRWLDHGYSKQSRGDILAKVREIPDIALFSMTM
jgi:hypothetical protein